MKRVISILAIALVSLFVQISFAGFAANSGRAVKEVQLPKLVLSAIEDIYESTRGRADCCGVSAIYVYEVNQKADVNDAVEQALALAAKINEDVRYTEWFDNLGGDTQMSLGKFVPPLLGDDSKAPEYLRRARKALIDYFGELTRYENVKILKKGHYELQNADGIVTVSISENGKWLFVRLYDYGA